MKYKEQHGSFIDFPGATMNIPSPTKVWTTKQSLVLLFCAHFLLQALEIPCDILIPAALEKQIHIGNAHNIQVCISFFGFHMLVEHVTWRHGKAHHSDRSNY
jgi:hypothetical protein